MFDICGNNVDFTDSGEWGSGVAFAVDVIRSGGRVR